MTEQPTNVWAWFADSAQRSVSGPIPSQLWTTLFHSLTAFALAAALAIPLAAWLAHRRKAEVAASWMVNLGRVVPTITILGFAVIVSLRNGLGFAPWPIIIALAALAVPPLFANTYTGVREASPDAVGAARAIGLSEGQILRRIELPLALPIILAAARVTLTQVVATEALGALFGSGGLGIYVRFGIATNDLVEVQAGALLVAGTAMAVDLVMWLAIRFGLPSGLRPIDQRRRRRTSRPLGGGSLQIPGPQPIGGTP